GTTILLVEQALEVALTLAQRVYVMDQGRVQFEGTPDDLRRDPEIQQRFLGVLSAEMDWQDRQISSGAGEGRVSNPSVLSLAVRQFSTTALERTPRDFCPAH